MNAASVISVQALAIFYLTPAEYGKFALAYVLYAAGVSAVHAVVCDAWQRSTKRRIISSWGQYSGALVSLVTTMTLPISIGLALLGFGLSSVWIGLAVFANLCRLGARYYSVANDEHRYVAPADIFGLVTTVATFYALDHFVGSFQSIAASWALGGVVALLASKHPRPRSRALREWVRGNASSIKALGADAVLVDATAIGVPLLMSPFLGAVNFGIYRSMSSTAIPVRLALNPLRPKIMAQPAGYFFEKARFVYVLTVALLFGAFVWLALWIVATEGLFGGGVLAALSAFALPAAIYVSASFVSSLFYISNRSHLSNHLLIVVGFVQLILAVGLPIGGFLIGGLSALILAFALTSVAHACIHCFVAFRHARQ
ncbi:hypothetical protein [Arthrobacter sp. L77]|uniref:hypothetical protein n=1 Tax=Arthrobacter sp. L77 TaxID=1496689 RepID=UPI0018CE2741|nr:hypothetical protein [Arthrobacter sp. L77]